MTRAVQIIAKLQRFRRPALRFIRSQTGQRAILLALAIVLLGYAGWSGFTRYQLTHRPETPAPAQVITNSTARPNETKIDTKTVEYKVAADKPRLISLPSIKAEGFIQQVGIDQHKAIAVPSNIHMAGWFNQSQLPGAKGLSIIDGHLDGRTGGGIFKDLAKLNPGDQFTVGYGDNSTKTFIVRQVKSAPTAETAAILFSQDAKISHQLNLITCGGNYDESRKEYAERVVVMAELVPKI